ncbi:MAG: ParA family protein [Planctomycetes bacterium]|nr:ParA family protein [Planctomycetota bacterium]
MTSKGGAGKTTLTEQFAISLSQRKLKVLIVDLDSQATITKSLRRNTEVETSNFFSGLKTMGSLVARLLRSDNKEEFAEEMLSGSELKRVVEEAILATDYDGISIIPSNKRIISDGLDLATQNGSLTILRYILKSVQDNYDWIFLDVPSYQDAQTANVLAHHSVDYIVCPSEPSEKDIEGLVQFASDMLKKSTLNNTDACIVGAVINNANPRTNVYHESMGEIAAYFFRRAAFMLSRTFTGDRGEAKKRAQDEIMEIARVVSKDLLGDDGPNQFMKAFKLMESDTAGSVKAVPELPIIVQKTCIEISKSIGVWTGIPITSTISSTVRLKSITSLTDGLLSIKIEETRKEAKEVFTEVEMAIELIENIRKEED